METIKLIIPTMKSQHCQMAVTNTVKILGGTVKNMAATEAEIKLVSGLTKETVIKAIESAGYKVSNN